MKVARRFADLFGCGNRAGPLGLLQGLESTVQPLPKAGQLRLELGLFHLGLKPFDMAGQFPGFFGRIFRSGS